MQSVIDDTYRQCKAEILKPKEEMHNAVKKIYSFFTVEEINRKIVEMLRPKGVTTPIEIVFQSISGLHKAIPNHKGDWYFTGDFPTPGGTRSCNIAYINFIEKVYRNKQIF